MNQNEIKITDLIDRENMKSDPSFGYWNDSNKEKKKAFNVEVGFDRLEKSPHLNDIFKQLISCMSVSNLSEENKSILSLGSGTCWLESWWLKEKKPNNLVAVDFSKHRIHELAPMTFEHYGYNYPIQLIRGDFLNLGMEEDLFDIVLLSQAFHHSQDPVKLLREVWRLSKDQARILIIGEHFFDRLDHVKQALRHFVKFLINYKNYRQSHSFIPGYSDLFPPHIEQGDNHYSKAEYNEMFEEVGNFNVNHLIAEKEGIQAFILTVKK